jgi:hypothetical protein
MNNFIIKQSGAWDIDNTIVETGKISNYHIAIVLA